MGVRALPGPRRGRGGAAAVAATVGDGCRLIFSAPTRPQPRTPNPQGDGDFATVRSCLGLRD